MESTIVALENLRPEDAPFVGGKAAKLGQLLSAGFPVPPGFCLSTTAFRSWVAPYQETIPRLLSRPDLTDPANAREAADEIAVLLEGVGIPAPIEAALTDNLFASALFAVRSSSTAEDRADVSFAGQYETVLGVRGINAVTDAILTCWRSFFTPHAIVARASANALTGSESMALLLQEMIEAECSGVVFSLDPIHPASGLLVVNAAWGLGTGVVDSQAAADTYRISRTDLRPEERHIVEKPIQINLSPEGELRPEPVPDERQRAACLPNSWLRKVAQFTVAAENVLGGPQDIEWAIRNNQFWMLQSRPITTLPSEFLSRAPSPLSEEDKAGPLWQISGQSQHRVPLPLDLDIEAIRAASTSESCLLSGSIWSRWGRQPETDIRKIVNGRTYIRSVPSGLHAGDGRIRRNASAELANRLRESDITPWEYYAPEIIQATKRLARFDRANSNELALSFHLEDAFGAYRRHWAIHFAMPHVNDFGRPFYQAFTRLTGCKERDALEISLPLLEGAGNMLTRLVDGLYALACTARVTQAESILTGREPGGMERLRSMPDAAPLCKGMDDFLAIYGDRSGLGVGSPPAIHITTWREEPELIFPMIAPYLVSGVESPETLRRRGNAERERQAEALACSEDREAAAIFLRWLPLMRRARTDLENHNHYIDQMAVGQLRSALLASGRWLAERGLLAERDDIFWLHREEITDTLQSDSPASLLLTVSERKQAHEALERIVPQPILGIPNKHLEPCTLYSDEVTVEAQPETDTSILRGVGASAGTVRGRARVIPPDVTFPDIAPGEILIAESAGPAWTPLFPILGGLILNRTALFSHAATTAREYGIPAVVNIKAPTLRIPDGAWVTLNGATGEITIEPPDAREETTD